LNFRGREAAERAADRRKREDDAPRLRVDVPALATLKLTIQEGRGSVTSPETSYVRHVQVDRAPALFEIPCGDPACSGGGYDLTSPILRALRSGAKEFAAEDACRGSIGNNGCGRTLKAIGTATYRP
jgi:hypothetical protein